MPYKGDKYCDNCFCSRKNYASNYHEEEIFKKNWGLYLIPNYGMGLLIARGVQSLTYPGGIVYHVYTEGRHEQWSKNKKGKDNMKKCDKCNTWATLYYQLETYE